MGFDMTANKLSVVIEANTGQFKKEIDKVINKLELLSKTTIKYTKNVTKAFKSMNSAIDKLDVGDTLEDALSKSIEAIDGDDAFSKLINEIDGIGKSASRSTNETKESLSSFLKEIVALDIGNKIRKSIDPEIRKIYNTKILKNIANDTNQLGKTVQKNANIIGTALKKIKKSFVILYAIHGIKKAVEVAVKAFESDRLFKRILGDYAKSTYEWSEKVSRSLGVLDTAVRKDTQVIYTMVKTLGIGEKTSLKMAKGVALLAQDMASFYDIDPETAFDKIQSGLTGIGVPLKELGIIIDDSIIKQTAYRKGIAQFGSELTVQQKVLARYITIMEQTNNAHGHLSRTVDSTSNRFRRLKTEIIECFRTVGNMLKPIVDSILNALNALFVAINRVLKGLANFLGIKNSSLSEETEKANDNIKNIADEMQDATDNAKKMKKYLASFDEIENLVHDENTESDENSIGNILEFPSLSDYDAGIVEGKANSLVEKINKIFDSIHVPKIDFTPLSSSLNTLLDALKPFGESIWDGLKWGIDNVLTPLASFTIETAIPEGLDMISSVLNKISGKDESTVLPDTTAISDAQDTSAATPQTAVEIPVQLSTDVSTLFDDIKTPEPICIDVNTDAITVARGNIISEFDAISINAGSLGDTLSSIWDTNPLQTFISTIGDLCVALGGLVGTLGKDALSNITGTWSKIEGNVSGSIANITKLWTLFWFDVDNAIVKWSPKITAGISNVFNSIWSDAIEPAVTIAAGIWEDFTKSLAKFWEEWGAPVVDKIGEAINGVVDAFNTTWTNIVKPILDVLFSELKDFWENHGKPMVDKVLNFIGKLADGVLELFNKAFLPAYKWLVEKLSPILNWLAESVAKQFSAKWAIIVDTIGNVADALSGLVDFIVGVFTGDWNKAWKGLSDSLDAIFNGVVDIFKSAINLIITGINTFIKAINKIKIDIPEWVPVIGGGSFGFNIPEIPKLARGGIVSSPTIAMIGEAGKEAVVPLENNTGWIDKLASKIAVMLAAMRANEDNRPINVNVTTELNGKVVSKELIRDLNKEARRLGYKPLLAT